uniref:Uncharacterized protein n=1 Tax=viral metagenome TaxID=1070528 RepID=A0A6C0D045_9ZZZZ
MPRRTNTITKSRSKTRSRSRKSRSKTNSRTRTNSINKSRSRSRRKYRGGCKECDNSKTWKSTGPMYGGSNPDQISKDIFSHVTNSIVRSVA